jgi:hypothetical protein
MRHKRALQKLVAALGALGTAKTEALQARLGAKPSAQSPKRHG